MSLNRHTWVRIGIIGLYLKVQMSISNFKEQQRICENYVASPYIESFVSHYNMGCQLLSRKLRFPPLLEGINFVKGKFAKQSDITKEYLWHHIENRFKRILDTKWKYSITNMHAHFYPLRANLCTRKYANK